MATWSSTARVLAGAAVGSGARLGGRALAARCRPARRSVARAGRIAVARAIRTAGTDVAEGRQLDRRPGGVGVAVAARSLGVAVDDLDEHVVASGVARAEVLGDRHGPMAATSAPDRDREVRLALGHVLRQQEVEQRD